MEFERSARALRCATVGIFSQNFLSPYSQKTHLQRAVHLRCLSMVIAQEPAQSIAALNRAVEANVGTPRERQHIALPLVIPLGVVMLDVFGQGPPPLRCTQCSIHDEVPWSRSTLLPSLTLIEGHKALEQKTCVCRKLDSAILVMKPAENGSGCNGADALDRPMDGSIKAQCAMGPRIIVVDGIRAENPAQMAFPEHDVVDAFPSDRAD
jgi:hypothetical protein